MGPKKEEEASRAAHVKEKLELDSRLTQRGTAKMWSECNENLLDLPCGILPMLPTRVRLPKSTRSAVLVVLLPSWDRANWALSSRASGCLIQGSHLISAASPDPAQRFILLQSPSSPILLLHLNVLILQPLSPSICFPTIAIFAILCNVFLSLILFLLSPLHPGSIWPFSSYCNNRLHKVSAYTASYHAALKMMILRGLLWLSSN